MKDFQALKAAVMEDNTLNENIQKEYARIMEAEEAENDLDALMMATEKFGYILTMEDIEKEAAEKQELDLDDLAMVAGGVQLGSTNFTDFYTSIFRRLTSFK